MSRKINNLEELLQEKARLKAQLDIVQAEMNAGVQRTRQEFMILVEEKFSLSKQIGQLFKGDDNQGIGTTALQAVGRVASRGTWWGGIASTLLPVALNFVRRQFTRQKERKAAKLALRESTQSAPDIPAETTPKPAKRGLFRRKKKDAENE